MLLEIRKTKECRNGAYGTFTILGRERARILIAMKLNPTLAEYAATLLHEMLHCYTSLLRVEGYKVTNKKEHKWIEDCEVAVIKLMQKNLGRK